MFTSPSQRTPPTRFPFSPPTRSAARCWPGAEGPDPMFFCFRPGKPFAPVVASLLHTQKTDDFLLALCDACAGDALLRAYCCGFFTHYATDTTFHPFVYAHSLTAAGKYSGNAHCTLEHQLETLHYRREGHATGLPVQMGGFAALDAAQRKKIAAALSAALARVFPDSVLSPVRLEKCFSDAVGLCRFLRSEDGRRYRTLGGVLSPFKLDEALHAHMMPAEPPQADIANDAHARGRPSGRRTRFGMTASAISSPLPSPAPRRWLPPRTR